MNKQEKPAPTAQPVSRVLTLLQLIRAPNTFTAVADVAMGSLVVTGSLSNWPGLIALAVASSALYSAGMVLNDVYDLETDLRERPHRPIPSGRVSRQTAARIGFFLLGFGVAVAAAIGLRGSAEGVPTWRCGVVAALLALSILLYDAVFKATSVAPWFMGCCRMFNVLLGMSLAARAPEFGPGFYEYNGFHLAVAGGIGIYIAGVTWFARTEAVESSRIQLILAVVVMFGGITLLAVAPRLAPVGSTFELAPLTTWPAALALLTVVQLRRCLIAIVDPQPKRVQAAVKLCIFSLIVLDAAVVMLTCQWYYAVAVLALLLPGMFLGRWVYST